MRKKEESGRGVSTLEPTQFIEQKAVETKLKLFFLFQINQQAKINLVSLSFSFV